MSAYYYSMENSNDGESEGYAPGNNNSNYKLKDPWSPQPPPPSSSSSSSSSSLSNLGTELNNHRASLARVVAAFPPAGHAFDLRKIVDVIVLMVDEKHMELQATICENESCSAVAVPVTFPHPCHGDSATTLQTSMGNFDECVLENLDELDHEAELLLQRAELDSLNFESQAAGVRQHQALVDTNNVKCPPWWVQPTTSDMVNECDTLRNLLNEAEFQSEIRSLAKLGLGLEAKAPAAQEAAVVAIGPAGMIVRALFLGSNYDDAVEVPISFPSPACNADQLRNLVTGVVEYAGQL